MYSTLSSISYVRASRFTNDFIIIVNIITSLDDHHHHHYHHRYHSSTCGPATTVSVFCSSCPRLGHHPNVRTEGEAVSETAWRFTRLVLHPKQVTVMQNSDPMVFLTGPPGTGKTLMLVLKGLDWLRLGNGEHVQVVSTWHESVAASHMVAGQLEQTAGPSVTQRVHLHSFNLRTAGTSERHRKKVVSAAAEALVKAAGGGPVLVIADEASHDKYVQIISSSVIHSQSRRAA